MKKTKAALISLVVTISLLLTSNVSASIADYTSRHYLDPDLANTICTCIGMGDIGYNLYYSSKCATDRYAVYSAQDISDYLSFQVPQNCGDYGHYISSTAVTYAIDTSTYESEISAGRVVGICCSTSYNGTANHFKVGVGYTVDVVGNQLIHNMKIDDPYDMSLHISEISDQQAHYWKQTVYNIVKKTIQF